MSSDIRDQRFAQVVGDQLVVEKLAEDFGFGEGPVWDLANRRLIFSDMKDDHMRAWSAGAGITTFRKPSNKANGNTYDSQGRLVTCEHATSRVVRLEADGQLTVLASHYGEHELNSPNDIVVKSDGSIYFSDPSFGRIREDVGVPRPLHLDFRGVYRIPPGGGPTVLLAKDFEQPNGLCFTRDEKHLLINDTPRKHVRRFDVQPDGTLTGGAVWVETVGEGAGAPDGMRFDSADNLYCTGPGGVHVFLPDRTCLGVIHTPERVTNCCWGDDDLRTLYMTGITALYRVRVRVPGRLTY